MDSAGTKPRSMGGTRLNTRLKSAYLPVAAFCPPNVGFLRAFNVVALKQLATVIKLGAAVP